MNEASKRNFKHVIPRVNATLVIPSFQYDFLDWFTLSVVEGFVSMQSEQKEFVTI